jgi:hypothetical protein
MTASCAVPLPEAVAPLASGESPIGVCPGSHSFLPFSAEWGALWNRCARDSRRCRSSGLTITTVRGRPVRMLVSL